MNANSQKILTALVLLALTVSCTARRCPLLHANEGTNRTGCYIVVLHRATTQERFTEILKRVSSMADGSKVSGVVRTVSKAFTVKLSAYSLNLLRQFPEVDYIEEETMAEGAQQTPLPWHLDRLDQRSLPLDSSYQPIGDGEGVDIYILDSGINYSHEEFENRAKYAGYDPMDVHRGETRRGDDCYGHGTHVASLAGGAKYGAAKKATLYSVRVLDCENRGPWSTTLEGIDYTMRVIAERKRPAVVSMSLSGGFTRSVNDAVERLHSSGVPVVAAAGNAQSDACSRTPASSSSTITVAGSAITDGIYFATNYGPCVNIFAPGSRVRGADFLCSDCSKLLSGTSMSTPLVSGVIAILLQREPMSTPLEIVSQLNSLSITGALNLTSIPSRFRLRTPNRVVSVPGTYSQQKLDKIILRKYFQSLFNQISKHELVTSVGGLHVLMLTDCKFVDL